ncbi:MAG: hypothetical protein J5817_05545 [Treponema sp.]|nr:hypothetical protein [Treponema sp.]
MKKVFESKYAAEVENLKRHLEDECFESEIHETFENYELLVDENIYDEVLVKLEGMKKKLSGNIVVEKAASSGKGKKADGYERGTFSYFVEEFFRLNFIKLVLISALYALLVGLGFVVYGIFTFGMEKVIGEKGLLVFVPTFCIAMILSLIILISSRFYRVFSFVREIFSIRLCSDDFYSEEKEKAFAFIKAIFGHAFILGVIIYSFFKVSS